MKETNIYLSDEDTYLVKVAQMIAEDQGVSVSRVFVQALKYYLVHYPEASALFTDSDTHCLESDCTLPATK